MKTIALCGLAVATLGSTGFVGYKLAKSPVSGPRDIVTQGDVQATLQEARNLMTALQEHGWNWADVRRYHDGQFRPPDQDFAYDELLRESSQPFSQLDLEPLYRDEIAFYTDLYVRNDFERIPGVEGRAHYSGFWIVGWRNGNITRVPMADVRLLQVSSDRRVYVFPGMSAYRDDLPRPTL